MRRDEGDQVVGEQDVAAPGAGIVAFRHVTFEGGTDMVRRCHR